MTTVATVGLVAAAFFLGGLIGYALGIYDEKDKKKRSEVRAPHWINCHRCVSCGHIGDAHHHMFGHDPCRKCGNKKRDDLVATWNGHRWITKDDECEAHHVHVNEPGADADVSS